MLKKNSSSHIHIISHILISVAIFIFFAVISGIIQLSYILMKTGWDLEKAMDILNENIYYGIETGAILGSYFSIILVCIFIEYIYKENIYSYLKINKTSFYQTFKYLIIFIIWMVSISYITEKFGITKLSEGEDFAQGLIKPETSLILLLLAVGIIQPIFEEVLFRGFLFTHIERKWGAITAILLTSITFTFVHFQYNIMILALVLFPMAIVLGIARWKTNSLIPPIIIHCINNTVVLFITINSFTPITENILPSKPIDDSTRTYQEEGNENYIPQSLENGRNNYTPQYQVRKEYTPKQNYDYNPQ